MFLPDVNVVSFLRSSGCLDSALQPLRADLRVFKVAFVTVEAFGGKGRVKVAEIINRNESESLLLLLHR